MGPTYNIIVFKCVGHGWSLDENWGWIAIFKQSNLTFDLATRPWPPVNTEPNLAFNIIYLGNLHYQHC